MIHWHATVWYSREQKKRLCSSVTLSACKSWTNPNFLLPLEKSTWQFSPNKLKEVRVRLSLNVWFHHSIQAWQLKLSENTTLKMKKLNMTRFSNYALRLYAGLSSVQWKSISVRLKNRVNLLDLSPFQLSHGEIVFKWCESGEMWKLWSHIISSKWWMSSWNRFFLHRASDFLSNGNALEIESN